MGFTKSRPSTAANSSKDVNATSPTKQESAPYHPSRHRRRRRHSTRGRTMQFIILLLVVMLMVVFIGWINTWVNLNASEDERVTLATDLRYKTKELSRLTTREKELTENLKAMVEKRLPGLREFRFDTTLTIDEGYVRNVSFTQTGLSMDKRYEYKLVLENNSPDTLTPSVRVLLFDEAGIQCGSAKVTAKAAVSNSEIEFLEPGEIRAYTAAILIDRTSPPHYFQIYLE